MNDNNLFNNKDHLYFSFTVANFNICNKICHFKMCKMGAHVTQA